MHSKNKEGITKKLEDYSEDEVLQAFQEQSMALSKYLTKQKKSRIRETKHLSTDADSSTDTTVGWTKNTQKPIFFF